MYKLVPEDDENLKKECVPFNFENPPVDPHELFENLKLTMIDSMGVGLSANQVGLPYRVFVFGDPTDPNSIKPVFNPRIVELSKEENIIEEGCLSYPGLFIKIKRPAYVRARFADIHGKVDTYVYDGLPGRIFLHEYDHMEGIIFKTRASQLRLAMGYKQKQKLDRLRKQRMRLQ